MQRYDNMVECAKETLKQVVLDGTDDLPLMLQRAFRDAAITLCDELDKMELDGLSPDAIAAFNRYKSAMAEPEGEEEGADAA